MFLFVISLLLLLSLSKPLKPLLVISLTKPL